MLVVRNPSPDLSQVIEFCWSASGGACNGTAFHQLFPGSATDLVFRFSPDCCRMALLGPSTSKAAVEIHGASHYFGIRFRTGQTPGIAAVHPAEIINHRVEIDSLAGERIDSLADRFLSLADHTARQHVLESLVRNHRPLLSDDRARQATLLLEMHGGRLRTADLASRMGMHVRNLERLFMRHIGLPPKFVSRLARLKTVLALLRTGGFGSMAELAQQCGYADQPHMINDFKKLTGCIPGAIGPGFTGRLAAPPSTGTVHRCRP